MKVVIADKMSEQAQTILKQQGIEADARPANGEISLEDVIGEADALLVRSATTVTPELLAKAPKLKAVGRAGIGVDNIDITAATDAKVVVMNTPLANAVSTAEHAIALMFSIARLIPQANTSTHAGKWEKALFKGSEISNKNLGIIGCGNIGKIVANRALGLQMKVKVYDPMLSVTDADRLQVKKVTLEELLTTADFITLHTPLLAETRNIISAAEFEKMKKGVYLINAARGGLVDETALKDALDNGHVAGAALDVYVEEPLREHPLCNHPKVVMTPHIAASTAEAQANVAIQIAEQVAEFLQSGQATHALNDIK